MSNVTDVGHALIEALDIISAIGKKDIWIGNLEIEVSLGIMLFSSYSRNIFSASENKKQHEFELSHFNRTPFSKTGLALTISGE